MGTRRCQAHMSHDTIFSRVRGPRCGPSRFWSLWISKEQRPERLPKRGASRGEVASFDAPLDRPVVALLILVSRSEPQRDPGALRPQHQLCRAMQTATILVRIPSKTDRFGAAALIECARSHAGVPPGSCASHLRASAALAELKACSQKNSDS